MISKKLPRFYSLLLVLVVMGLALLACTGIPSIMPQFVHTVPPSTPVNSTKIPKPADTLTDIMPKIFKVGDRVKIGNGVLMVLGWSEKDFPGYAQNSRRWQLDAGFRAIQPPYVASLRAGSYITADILVVNTGQVEVSISSTLQMSLKDKTAREYPPDPVDLISPLATQKDTPDGILMPGERIRGTVGFHMPPNPTGLQFVFDASAFGSGKVIVDLGDKPIAAQVPDKVEGETGQAASSNKLGEAVQAGTLSVTVNDTKVINGDQSNEPPDGYQFLLVDLTIENKGADSAQISSMAQLWVKDMTGQRYRADFPAMRAANGTAPDGELSAGEKLKGQVAYAVPKDAEGLIFVFDDSMSGGNRISVALP